MLSHNLINVEFHIILSPVIRIWRDKVGRRSNPVHNNLYEVMVSPSIRKTNHEVHINGLQLQSWNLNNLSKIVRLKIFCLNLLTIRTLGHIICNVRLHAISPIDVFMIMIHFGSYEMYEVCGTMGLFNDHSPQIIHIWYTQPVLVLWRHLQKKKTHSSLSN